ncbi:MAG TPA: TIGR03790 family protein [Chthoniobacterales bacterium]|jgi:uncharacterized protein (TIGR03790 family)
MNQLLCVLVTVSLGTSTLLAANSTDLAQATVIVYNRKASDSLTLARFYAKARGIPEDHLIGLECSTEEEINRQDYDAKIAEPLRRVFTQHQWWTLGKELDGHPTVRTMRIHFVALMRGVPLKIRAIETYPGDHPEDNPTGKENRGSVDSELAALGLFSRQISGPIVNPYFQSFRAIQELDGLPLLLVCRLDGPSEAVVRRMISDAVATENSGLWGRAYVDGADHSSGALADGDKWLQSVVKDLRSVGIPTVYDQEGALFPSGFPMNDCVLYYGWYADGVTGPFVDPDFHFAPGAVAVHIYSFSASTLRSPEAGWVGPLLSKGAAASLGNVYEPYLQLTHHLDIFNNRLLHGFTFAESAYMSLCTLSWMNVAVGDPLYRPYKDWLQLETGRDENKKSDWQMYHEFALQNAKAERLEYLKNGRLAASRASNGPMAEDLALQEKERGDFAAAIGYLREARTLYSKPDDILRTVLEQVDALTRSGDKKAAAALANETIRVVPDASASTLLRKLAEELNSGSAAATKAP